jgi:hypothetical protein
MQRMRFAGLFLPLITLCAPALSQDAPATAQDSVYLLLKVNPVSGTIDSVDVTRATSDKPGFESDFLDVAVELVREFVFTPMPELKAPHRICVPFVFALG